MIIFNYKKELTKFMFYILCLFLILFIIVNNLKITTKTKKTFIETSTIKDENENYNIYVEYPRFNNNKIDSIISNVIYSYIKEFKYKKISKNKILNITYKLYYFNDYVNITFDIENTLTKIKNKNILINLKTKKLDYITNIYDKNYLLNEIKKLVYYKYSKNIYDMIINTSLNNYTYIIDDNSITIYFNNINLNKIDYVPYITINTNNTINTSKQIDTKLNKKYIAFTYDDGPSEYTSELLKTLELNNSSATFFMIGNRMKNYKSVIKEIFSSESEVAHHSYSHKDLSKLNQKVLNEELNSTNIIYKEITGENLKYLRPPYNKYNQNIINTNYEIVTWNIDTKDWLVKDSTKIYNSVISSACDGCIVLMHDIYPQTIEATKMLLPKLNEMGFEVLSISKLSKIKKYDFTKHDITSIIK